MASYDFNAPRLFVDAPLREGARIGLDRAQANYLLNVLRLRDGEAALVFNGQDGEWRAGNAGGGGKAAELVCAGGGGGGAPRAGPRPGLAPPKHAPPA